MKQSNIEKSFLISDLAGKVIGSFKDVFLGIYFLKITQGNIVDVAQYYIVFFMMYVLCLFIVNRLQKVNLIQMFRIGIFLNLMQCVILLNLGERISNYIIPFALFSSIGNAFYYYPEQILIKRINAQKDFQSYITKDQIIKYMVSILFPIILGFCISKNSYDLAFIVLIGVIFISFVFSFDMKGLELEHGKINLKAFFQHIKQNGNQELMKWLSLRTIVRGLSSFGVLATLLTILTFLVVSTELSLGSISSFITAISIVVIYIMNKISKQKLSRIFMPVALIQSGIVIFLTFGMLHFNLNASISIGNFAVTIGFLLVLLYNMINGISNPIFETANTVVFYECMRIQNVTLEDEPNYVFWFEIMINVARSVGYFILIIVSQIGFNIDIIATLIVAFTLVYIVFAYTLKRIIKKYLT